MQLERREASPNSFGTRLRRFVGSVLLLLIAALAGIASPLEAQRRGASGSTAAIVGQVLDASTGAGVVGARITIEGTTWSVYSGQNGHFRISPLAPGSYTIEVQAPGYVSAVRTTNIRIGVLSPEVVSLEPSVLLLDELVAIGHGDALRRKEIGASVTAIRAADLAAAPVSTVSEFSQGRAPGVMVLPQGGKPGQGSRILFRGVRGLTGNVQPIIFLDGIRIDNSAENGLRTGVDGIHEFGGESWAGIDDINVDDIERIEILSGPAASALYGSEGANGVLQIFTKRGSGERQRITVRSEYGVSSTPRSWWSGPQHADWFYDTFVRRGRHARVNLSMSGGVDRFNYYAGATLRSQEGVLPQTGVDYWSFRANMRAMPLHSIAIDIHTGFSVREVDLPYDGGSRWGLSRSGMVGGEAGLQVTPEEILTYDVGLSANRFTAGARIEHRPSSRISHSLLLGADIFNSDNVDFNPFGTTFIDGGKKLNNRRHVTLLTLDYRGSVNYDLGPFRAATAFGVQGMKHDEAYTLAIGYNFAGPGLGVVEAAGTTDGDQNRLFHRMAGGYVEESLNLKERLFLTAALRYDGHSAFGRANRFQWYPALSASYILSEHDFLPDLVESLRVRAAFGEAGSRPDAFQTERTWRSVAASGNRAGLITGKIGSPDLGPERTREWEGGIDLALAGGRVVLNGTYYLQQTRDALYPVFTSPSLGFREPQILNAGETVNRGVELKAHARVIEREGLRWSATAGLFTNSHEVESIGGENPLNLGGAQWIRPGHPVAAFFADSGAYIGPAFPTRNLQLGSRLDLGSRIRLSALVDHASGHYLQSNTSIVVEQGGDPLANPITEQGDFVFPADYWRLREVSLAYQLPTRLLRGLGVKNAELTLSGRNLWRSQSYAGLEAEASSEALEPLLNQSWFNTPLPRQLQVGVAAQF